MHGQISCICLHANEGRKSKTKDSVYNVHLNFVAFKYGKQINIRGIFLESPENFLGSKSYS